MDTLVIDALIALLGVFKAHPVVATIFGVLTTISTVVVAFQKPLGDIVRSTKTKKDDGIWHYVQLIANALTPNGSRIGEDVPEPKPEPPKPSPETHELPVSDETPTEQ